MRFGWDICIRLGTDDIEMSQMLVLCKWMESVKENEKSKKREGSSVKKIAAQKGLRPDGTLRDNVEGEGKGDFRFNKAWMDILIN